MAGPLSPGVGSLDPAPPSPSPRVPETRHSDDPPTSREPSSTASPATRFLARSPHPYHQQQSDLARSSDRLVLRRTLSRHKAQDSSPPPATTTDQLSTSYFPPAAKHSASPTSESGTEADDEHLLKGLPAPRGHLHKGVRGHSEPPSDASTPLLSPACFDPGGGLGGVIGTSAKPAEPGLAPPATATATPSNVFWTPNLARRSKLFLRRGVEASLLGILALAVALNPAVRPAVRAWKRELMLVAVLAAVLVVIYPVRIIVWAYWHRKPSRPIPVNFLRSSFDPAPLLYPPTIAILVSLLTSVDNPAVILPNIVLGLCSMPHELIPDVGSPPGISTAHWALTCLPLIWHRYAPVLPVGAPPLPELRPQLDISDLALLYPIHRCLTDILHLLTTSSLLPAELQLLSVGLINLLFFSRSPQMRMLQASLWIGGFCTLLSCSHAVRWGISLARVPKWRFRRVGTSSKKMPFARSVMTVVSLRRLRHDVLGIERGEDDAAYDTASSSDSVTAHAPVGSDIRARSPTRKSTSGRTTTSHTPSGRRKRAASATLRPFFKLTQDQAATRRWLYATHVYVCIFGICLLCRAWLMAHVLDGHDPILWFLAYVLGDAQWFRLEVVKANLDRWIPLPSRAVEFDSHRLPAGWIPRYRQLGLGLANTRLVIMAYAVSVLAVGLRLVFRLQSVYEVDTRRKGFHFIMVIAWIPTIFVDPCFASLIFAVALTAFLVLDLLRASQLPPLSRPIASFIAPYVDGRDLAGPVVISPIFLLIGCAIPLWLSMACLPRLYDVPGAGWEVRDREVAMVTGVVCVGLGDAAASLIGRRWGIHKWPWGGSKSLEGSIAFAAAVVAGLAASRAWLLFGGWEATGAGAVAGWGGASLRKMSLCAGVASVTEAVLTGGNDNVIVPVVLWTCVKGVGL